MRYFVWYSKDERLPGRGLFLVFSPKRPDRKEFVPAGHTTIRRQSEEPADGGCLADDMFRRDALQIQVAAVSAMGIQQMPKWSAASAESCFARFAPPRQNPADTKHIVNDCPPPGAPEIRTAARWAKKLRRLDFQSPLSGWDPETRKEADLMQARYNENPKE